MTAMPAGVGEGAQDAVVASDEQHAPRARLLGALIARFGDLRAVPDAEPASAEEMPLLPGEHGRVHIGGPWQHPALAERLEGRREAGLVNGRARMPGLTDHTVKGRQDGASCPALARGPQNAGGKKARARGRDGCPVTVAMPRARNGRWMAGMDGR